MMKNLGLGGTCKGTNMDAFLASQGIKDFPFVHVHVVHVVGMLHFLFHTFHCEFFLYSDQEWCLIAMPNV